MPLPLELRQASLANVAVNVDDMHFGLSSFNGNATWVNEKIYIFPATAMNVNAIFPDTVAAVAPIKIDVNKDNLSINETINQIFNKPLINSLPTVNIPLDIYVNSLKGNNWLLHIGGEDYEFNDVTIQASTENNFINAKLVQTVAIRSSSIIDKRASTLSFNAPDKPSTSSFSLADTAEATIIHNKKIEKTILRTFTPKCLQ